MSSIVNKVKDAMHGNHETGDKRTSRHDMTEAERAKHDSASQGLSGTHGTSNVHATAQPDRYMSAGEMNPRTTGTEARGSSDLPGSFPGEHDLNSSRHSDGREYVPPRGTQVGQGSTGIRTGYDSTEYPVTGRNTTGNYDQLTGNRGNVDDRYLMDPASKDVKSNIMHTPTTSGTTYEQDSRHDGKLHKRDDPRNYTGSQDTGSHRLGKNHHGTETIGGQQYEQQSNREYGQNKHRHGHHGAEAAAVGGAGGIVASQIPERRRVADSDRDTYSGASGQGSHLASSTQGNSANSNVHSTVTGYGSREDERNNGRTYGSAPGVTSGTGAVPHEAGDGSRVGGTGSTALGAGALGAGAAGLASHEHNKHKYQDNGHGEQYGSSTTQRDPISSSQYGNTSGYGNSGATGNTGTGYGTSNQPGNGNSQQGSQVYSAGNTPFSGGDHYGPGHSSAKVYHQCDHCGRDNDISHYFKRDAIYRIHRNA